MAQMLKSGDEGLDLAARVKNGESLVLNRRVLAILRRSAREVGIASQDVESALQSTGTAAALLKMIAERKRRNSRRLARALLKMYRHRDAGDLASARKEMRTLLAVADDPHHRMIAQGHLDPLDDAKPSKGKAPARNAAPARPAPVQTRPKKALARNRRNTGKRS